MQKIPLISFHFDGPLISPKIKAVFLDPDHPYRGTVKKLKHENDCWSINYNYAHAGFYRVSDDAEWLERPANLIQIFKPNFEHEAYYNSSKPIPRGILLFEKGEELGLDKLIDPLTGHARIHDLDMIVGKIMLEIGKTTLLHGNEAFWEAQQLLCKCIGLLLRSVNSFKTGEFEITEQYKYEDKNIKLMQDVDNYIRQNYMYNIDLKKIAADLSLSLSTLTHAYSKASGKSPKQALLDYRIQVSKQMLLEGYSQQQISDSCGFCNSFYFSKKFKKSTGISPKYYKK